MPKRNMYIIGGAVLLILIVAAVGVFFLLPTLTSANRSATATPTATVQPGATPASRGNGVAKLLRQYSTTIKDQIAQGLHLTPDALTTQLQSGKTLGEIATAQGISPTQLVSVETNAIQGSLQPAVNSGTITQDQVTRVVKRLENNPQMLIRLLVGKTKQTRPAMTPTPAQ